MTIPGLKRFQPTASKGPSADSVVGGNRPIKIEMTPPSPAPPLERDVLKRLLEKMNISVQTGSLTQAIAAVQQAGPSSPLAEQVRRVLNYLQIRRVRAAVVSWQRFDQRYLPVMIAFQGQWWLVERGGQQTLILSDAAGNYREEANEALAESPVIWLSQPAAAADEGREATDNRAARLVLRELFKRRGWVLDVLVATLVINCLAIFTSIFAMQVYDRVVPTLAYATLWTLVAGMLIVSAIDWLLKTLRARILDSVACAADKNISQQVFDHILRLRLDTAPRSFGTLAAQVNGLDAARQFFSSGVIFILVDMPFALLFIAVIAVIGRAVAWVYLLLLPVALLLGITAQVRLRKLMRRQISRNNERQGLLVDVIRGAESIRASNAGWRFSQQWKEFTESITGYGIVQKAINTGATVTTGTLASLGYVCAIVVGVGQIESGHLTMGGLIACSILGGRVIAPIARAVQYLSQWQSVSQSLKMVDEVLKRDTERPTHQTLLVPERAPDRMEFQEIRFSYPGSPIIQLNVPRLQINAGERVMVLGSIGSGKSTLLKLLAGLYRPNDGRVRLGDADLWETDPQVVAGHVGYLPQTVDLFRGTLRSNLTLAGAVSDSLLLTVCAQLGIDAISDGNPKGMDLEISEGGGGLSGGQRQLVAMARLFLARPRIWLLDEPTASLDGDTEMRLLEAISARLASTDILVIATHRLRVALRLVNRVIVVQKGEVIQDGPPNQVLPRLALQGPVPPAQGQPAAVRVLGMNRHQPSPSINREPLDVI